ncbi:MAG: phosphoribosylformylglycinamidine synthase, purS protein [Alphaproteobacteria bacterium]|jgi:phosphoribosylformylglycinamidine synthase PurS subunit|nr:phosphoribosylformylglycinamidine synthase, purS protein [Alphaproteobacteria bacterium]
MKVMVSISLKPGVLDPQARAIENSLASLGYQDVKGVSTGKQIILDLDEDDEARARQKSAKMCETLLVNTVIENYEITIMDEDD